MSKVKMRRTLVIQNKAVGEIVDVEAAIIKRMFCRKLCIKKQVIDIEVCL